MCSLPFLVPHHANPLTTFYGELTAVGLGLAAAFMLLRPAVWQPINLPVIVLVPLGLMAVLGVQVASGLAVYWQQHMLAALYLAWAALMVVLGAQLRREIGLEKIVPLLAWSVLVGGVLSAIVVGMQVTGFDKFAFVVPYKAGRYAANLAQVNHLANYLGLALGSLLYLYATERLRGGWVVVFGLMMLAALALTGARMGWIYVVMLLVGAWLAGRRSADDGRRSKARGALWLIPAFALLQLLMPFLPIAGAPLMPAQKVVASMQGSSIRLQLFGEAWQTFLAHPWLGAGFGQFGWHDFMLAEAYPEHTGWNHHAHNLVLHLMAECGLAGAGILVAGALFWLLNVRRAPITPERWWLYALLGILAVHSLLEYPLWYAYFLGLAALLLGMGEEKSLQFRMDLGPVAVAGVLVFGAFSMVNLGTHYYKLEEWFMQGARGELKSAQFNRALDEMATMRRKSLMAPYIDFVMSRALPNRREFLEDKLAINGQVIRFLQGEQEVYSQAALLALAGRQQEARLQLQRAMIRHPGWAPRFHRQLLEQMLKGEIAQFPLVMAVQEFLPPPPSKLKHSSSGKNPGLIRDKAP